LPWQSSLLVGERVVSRCDRGLLETEYALFDRSEVLIGSTPTGHGVQELGYMTSAAYARARMHQAFVTADLAYDAFSALTARGHAGQLARSQTVVNVLPQLGPYEAFEGGTYDPIERRYVGTWLDLRTLAGACPLPDAAHLFQALHLLMVLEEVEDDVPVRLLTADATEESRSGERTWRKVSLSDVQEVAQALRAMPVLARSPDPCFDEAEFREEILRDLRARATASAIAQPRLHQLAATFARTGKTPPLGTTERITGALRLVDELRKHTELLKGGAHIRDVAEFLTAMAGERTTAPDLAILAARAWLAAGEPAHARHFAKLVVEGQSFSDESRIVALEILDSTTVTHESLVPPPATPIQPTPVIVISEGEPDRPAPPGASLPPSAPDLEHAIPDTERMPGAPVARVARPPAGPLRPEIVETLSPPPGVEESILQPGATPKTPDEARVAMIRLARELGRDYRLWYGTTLKTDVIAIDAMQRHLRRRFSEGALDEKHARQLQGELTRHGAMLSEILARRLCAEWTDLESQEPGHWAMSVPPGVLVWPIGRVYRFFGRGHREADLVAFYTELERVTRELPE
jgi:hypothetical protein